MDLWVPDLLGRRVRPGDQIAAAMIVGRSAEMRVGKVVGLPKDRYGETQVEVEWQAANYRNGVKKSKIQAKLQRFIWLPEDF